MVNTNALRAEWVKKGMTQSQVAERIGISSKTMSNRMKKKEFGTDEVNKLITLLSIKDPMQIFFADKVT